MAGLIALSSTAMGFASTAQAATKHKTYNVAYLSYSVANSYDAPMLAAAQAVAASAHNVRVTVFDAQGSYTTQVSQLQDAINSGKYQGIITQPIYGAALIPGVKLAIKKHIRVVNIDQILGPKLDTVDKQVPGLSVNVTFVPTDIGTKLGKLVVQACQENNLNPCNVGYLYDIKASALDVAIRKAFNAAIAGLLKPCGTTAAACWATSTLSPSTRLSRFAIAHPHLCRALRRALIQPLARLVNQPHAEIMLVLRRATKPAEIDILPDIVASGARRAARSVGLGPRGRPDRARVAGGARVGRRGFPGPRRRQWRAIR